MTAPVIIYVATTDTSSFSWLGTGFTDREARDALMRAWHAHADRTGADPDYITDDAINVVHGPVGTGWQDYEPVAGPAPRATLPDDALPDADERARQRGLGPR